jgi:predicted lipoprotein with Yx(FWY)xxD motif
MRNRWLAAAGLAAATVALAACGSSAASSPSGSGSGSTAKPVVASGAGIKTVSTSQGSVLTNAKGLTLYWYAIDTATKSNCNGKCATFWLPVAAGTKVASGVTLSGKFGSVTRSDGSKQLTYDNHPLYTFVEDTAPGQIKGNGVTTSGGATADLWWAMTPSGSKLATAPKPKTSSSSGSGGGYGY